MALFVKLQSEKVCSNLCLRRQKVPNITLLTKAMCKTLRISYSLHEGGNAKMKLEQERVKVEYDVNGPKITSPIAHHSITEN